jgi:toxin ParE1/3/4
MSYQLFLTDNAACDLEELYNYIEAYDTLEKADYVVDKIEEAFSILSDNPEHGAYAKELLAVE